MNVAPHGQPTPAADDSATDTSIALPSARGLAALQAGLVDRIKRAAIRHLHASERGERLLLRMYLDAEEASLDILRGQLRQAPPDWLMRQIRQHLAEEQVHTALFAAALDAKGAGYPSRLTPAGLSRRKLARWNQLADHHAQYFSQGAIVSAYAVTMCAEQMAARILQRHCETIGPAHAMHALFSRILADENRHVRLCAHTLQRLVAPHEMARLASLLAEVRKIAAAFGVSGALALYVAGLVVHALPGGRAR